VTAMFWFYDHRGHLSEGRARLEGALSRHQGQHWGQGQSRPIRALLARALCCAGGLAWVQGELAVARLRFEQSLALAQELEERHTIAYACDWLGLTAQSEGDHAKARVWFETAATLFRKGGNRWSLADALTLLGDSTPPDEKATAEALYRESLALYRELHDPWAALPLTSLGRLALRQGDYSKARALLNEAVALHREDRSRILIGIALASSGEAARCEDDLNQARELFEEARELGGAVGGKQTDHCLVAV